MVDPSKSGAYSEGESIQKLLAPCLYICSQEVDIEMNEITDAGQVPMAVHGTNLQAWKRIRKACSLTTDS